MIRILDQGERALLEDRSEELRRARAINDRFAHIAMVEAFLIGPKCAVRLARGVGMNPEAPGSCVKTGKSIVSGEGGRQGVTLIPLDFTSAREGSRPIRTTPAGETIAKRDR